MSKIPVIIDCDPGHDDAIALILAFSSDKLDVRGVTVVGGNQTLKKTSDNALRVLSYIGVDVPVALGAEGPMFQEPFIQNAIHGDTGLDGPQLPPPTLKPIDLSAVELMAKIIRESDEKITLIALGPLTNVGVFLLAYPELHEKISRICIMGGGAKHGNTTSAAEFNIWQDPEAASIVFSAGIPMTMHGIDATRKGYLLQSDIERFRGIGRVGKLVAELMDFFTQFAKAKNLPFSVHDANAVAWVIDPSIYTTKLANVEIDLEGALTKGCTVTDFRPWAKDPKYVDVSVDVDRQRFVDLLAGAFAHYNS